MHTHSLHCLHKPLPLLHVFIELAARERPEDTKNLVEFVYVVVVPHVARACKFSVCRKSTFSSVGIRALNEGHTICVQKTEK